MILAVTLTTLLANGHMLIILFTSWSLKRIAFCAKNCSILVTFKLAFCKVDIFNRACKFIRIGDTNFDAPDK
jgi:hypothetical protein